MYKITYILSYLIREFMLPNPFINMFEEGMAVLVNFVFGGILIPFAYLLTGTWYVSRKGEYWKGSLGFLFNYILLTYIMLAVSEVVSDVDWILGIFLFIYVILCFAEKKLLCLLLKKY